MTFAIGMQGNNQRRTKISSAILLRWGVTEMGRKSDMPVGFGTFGTGVTTALSQGLGTQPVRKEQLSTQVTISANSCEQVFTARRYASAVLAVIVCQSVCLSICLSVCLSQSELYKDG